MAVHAHATELSWHAQSCDLRTLLLAQINFNSSAPGQNGHRFADDSFRCIFVNEKFCILIEISLKFVPKGPIDNNPHWFRWLLGAE